MTGRPIISMPTTVPLSLTWDLSFVDSGHIALRSQKKYIGPQAPTRQLQQNTQQMLGGSTYNKKGHIAQYKDSGIQRRPHAPNRRAYASIHAPPGTTLSICAPAELVNIHPNPSCHFLSRGQSPPAPPSFVSPLPLSSSVRRCQVPS